MWTPKNKINKQTKLKQTHRHTEWTAGCQTGGVWGNWVKDMS